MKPSGHISDSIFNEWETGVTRLSQEKVTHADKITIINAVRTYAELKHFMAARDRAMPPGLSWTRAPKAQCGRSTPCDGPPGRASWGGHWKGSSRRQWLGPESNRGAQAVVIEPPMLSFLEDAIEDHIRLNNANWRRLLGCWLVGQGCLRYRHLSLSTPVKLTVSTMHAHCARGKQAHNRAGFDWAVPTRFHSGFNWGEHWLREYQHLAPEVAARAEFCYVLL